MRSWHLLSMALLKVEEGHFKIAILTLRSFAGLLLSRLQVFRSIALNIFMIQTLCKEMQLFKGSYFSVDAAALRHF